MTRRILERLVMVLVVGLMASGCAEQESATEPEDVSAAPAIFGNVVTASGKVVPVQWATLSFETGGPVEWLVSEGSEVAAGDVLARLSATDLEHAVTQARAALATAEAQLAAAQAGATLEEIANAEGSVATARANLDAAEATLTQAETSTQLAVDAAEAAVAQAQGTLAAAAAELTRAQAELAHLQAGARPEEIAIYQARLTQAEAELWFPTHVHTELIQREILGEPEEKARHEVQAVRAARDAAQAQLDLVQAGATTNEVAAARAGVTASRAQVTIAQAGVDAAEVALAQARAAQEDVAIFQAQVEAAEGQLAQAEAQRDRLEAGATAEELAVLEAQVAQAESALAQDESALEKAVLVAPFAGTVGGVYLRAGEWVAPGTPSLVLGDASALRVETTDLNEVDAARAAVGGAVTLTFDALPGRTTKGEVIRIAPMASTGQGGTNFTAVIEMTSPPEALRWGMTSFVDIEVD